MFVYTSLKGRRRRTCDLTIPQCWGGRLPTAVTGAHSAAPGCVCVRRGPGVSRVRGGRALPWSPPPGAAAALAQGSSCRTPPGEPGAALSLRPGESPFRIAPWPVAEAGGGEVTPHSCDLFQGDRWRLWPPPRWKPAARGLLKAWHDPSPGLLCGGQKGRPG